MRRMGKTLDIQEFYPAEMDVAAVEQTSDEICLKIYVRSNRCNCPNCGQESTHQHGTYERKIQDLPILGKRTYLFVNAYEYQCDNPKCQTTTFAENMNGFLGYYSRMTDRLANLVTLLALETSCEASARILKAMNVKVSGDTVIRLLLKRYSAQPAPACGNAIGVDDFAFKKGSTYGTIIVDEATHKPVALLDGRDGASLKEWLKGNKQVTTVSRDRASAYAKAVEEILPECIQIADRFHLHQNLMEAVKKVLKSEIPSVITLLADEKMETSDTQAAESEQSKKNGR